MKIKAGELGAVLAKLRYFLPTHDFRPIFSCFLFDDTKIAAFNGECALVYNYPAGFRVAVEGETLFKLVNGVGAERGLVLEAKEEYLQVRAESGKGKSKLIGKVKLADADEFLLPEPLEGEQEVQGQAFIEGLGLCFMSCKKGLGSIMNGVALTPRGMFSSDNLRLSWYKAFTAEFTAFLPYRAVECLLKLGASPSALACDGQLLQLWFADEAVFLTSLSSVEFPVDKVLGYFDGYKGASKFAFPADLPRALERSNGFQEGVPELSRKALLRLGEGGLTIESAGPAGELSESFESEVPFEGSFEVVPKFLKLALDKGLFAYYVEGKPLRCRGQGFDHLVTLSE